MSPTVWILGAGCLMMAMIFFPLVIRMLTASGRWQENFRGDSIPTSAGVLFIPVLAFAELALILIAPEALQTGTVAFQQNIAFAGLVAGLCVLGLIDDVYGGRRARGFRGHLAALLKGEPTTGLIKAAGGGLLALAAASWLAAQPSFEILTDGLLIALAINLFNLLDLRPGRALKWWFWALAMLLAFTPGREAWLFVAIAAGAALWLFPYDLKARVMLGDAGSNVLGGVAGFAAVATLGSAPRLVILLVLIALNLVSEKWSFSAIIDAVPPLRWFDELGREIARKSERA